MAHKSHFINNVWVEGLGTEIVSTDPASGETVWLGRSATDQEVDMAVTAAYEAFDSWANLDYQDRLSYLSAFQQKVVAHRDHLTRLICKETGKPWWEAGAEVDSVTAKIDITLEAFQERLKISTDSHAGASSITSFKPLGIIAVLGPFNMPAHLPNGHIVPALLAGNTVVFKPSSQAPSVAEFMIELWEAASVPSGVINLVQGGKSAGQALIDHPAVKGVFFTGSESTGKAIHRALGGYPEKLLALEMGGNNPLIVHKISNYKAAVYLTIVSAYITSGQRCSCARRLIVSSGSGSDTFLDNLAETVSKISVGHYEQRPEPFMGPVISPGAARDVLEFQKKLLDQGARPLLEVKIMNENQTMLSPGIIDVTPIVNRRDREVFGPLLQVIRAPDFDSAVAEANRTRFGLTAGLLSDDPDCYRKFFRKIRAGVVYWNRQTTGASSRLPFGGIGASGNYRPGGYFTVDYCAHPVASMESESVSIPRDILPGIHV